MPEERFDLIISKEGYDWDDPDPTHHIFNTYLSQTIKIFAKDLVSVSVNGYTTLNVTINHSLGFVPLLAIAIELKPGSGKFFFGTPIPLNTSDTDGYGICIYNDDNTYTDSNHIHIAITNLEGSTKTVRFAYLLFADNGR